MKKRKKKSSGRINRLVFEMWNEKHKVRRKKPKKGCFFFFSHFLLHLTRQHPRRTEQ